ncbi:hypothetical protein JAO29_00765 [Edaphobacter sp. HDX4]|uniref:hypothetical protein n=1 Tax=Edaphobacter sp. HDX4 TaxID=2794064 RepID=UPI002FE500F9
MRRSVMIAILGISCVSSYSQSVKVTPKTAKSPSDAEALLAKTKALYDTPFQMGLISFSCAIDFDFAEHLKSNFGDAARTDSPIAQLLEPIRYRVFVDHSGATLSVQPKLPDFSQLPVAAQLEESNRSLMQTGLSNWVPYAYGEVLPIAPTNYQFEKTATGYNLSMDGRGITGKLILDHDLHLLSGTIDTSQHIEITTNFADAPNGLVLAASSTNTDHAGVARFTYTYQVVDGFQLPQHVEVASEQNKMRLNYTLTDCKTQHGTVVHVAPPAKP